MTKGITFMSSNTKKMENFVGTINTHRNSELFFAEHTIDAKLISTLKRGVKACKEWSKLKGANESADSKEYSAYMSFLLKKAMKSI